MRRVHRLASGVHDGWTYRVEWDGLDEAGAEAASGVYFVRLDAVEI